MRAFGVTQYSEQLTELDVPRKELSPGDVRIEVVAAGVNPLDERLAAGGFQQLFPLAFPLVLGSDVAGRVLEVGSDVTAFAPGDEVYGMVGISHLGTFADEVVMPAAHVALKPRTVGFVEAASLPLVALTAWQALVEKGNLEAGSRVLVHGGSGGVGTVAVQLARHLGAHVISTASGHNADYVGGLGAHEVIDHRTVDFAEVVEDLDVVVDTQGGATLGKSLAVTRPGGVVVGLAGPPEPEFAKAVGLGEQATAGIRAMSAGVLDAARAHDVTYRFQFARPDGAQLARVAELVDAGAVVPQVEAVFPLADVQQAMTRLAAGGLRGKIVVSTEA